MPRKKNTRSRARSRKGPTVPVPAAALPDDVLAEVLGRLAPLDLAASRWVCRAWRDAVDARLRGHLLSRSVRGIFINYVAHRRHSSDFFSRPSTGPAICGGLDYLPCRGVMVADHCNGLVLCGDGERDYVVNPATRRWARLPRRPPPHMPGFGQSAYLAFEPAVSPHYQVFLIPPLPTSGKSDDGDREPEWPPASYVLHVFSSMADQWEEKTFLREGEAAGTVADMYSNRQYYDRYRAVYWRSALYVHCQHGFLTRISLTNQTYRVIRLPVVDELRRYAAYHLGRSLSGVYCAENNCRNRLQIWHLVESQRDQTEWVLKHDVDLETIARKFFFALYRKNLEEDHAEEMGGPWILQDVNYRKDLCYRDGSGKYKQPIVEESSDWSSDWSFYNDHVLDFEDADEWGYYNGSYHFLGFHPYKETAFLDFDFGTGAAYDWNSSRFQGLGSLEPKGYYYMQQGIDASFPYTPCWMGEFPGNEVETLLECKMLILRRKLELIAQLELEYDSDFTYVDEYQLRKRTGHAKRVKDSTAKSRRRHRIAAR